MSVITKYCSPEGLFTEISSSSFLPSSARAMGERLFLVTDAMATLGAPETRFSIGGVPIRREGARLVSPEGTLAGAHLAMDEAVRGA